MPREMIDFVEFHFAHERRFNIMVIIWIIIAASDQTLPDTYRDEQPTA